MPTLNLTDVIYDNGLRGLYYGVADKLPALVASLEIAAKRGSKIAKKELAIFKKMDELLIESELGKIL